MRHSRFVLFAAAALALALPGCGDKPNPAPVKEDSTLPKTGTAKVKLHADPDRKELYCRYKVTGGTAGAALKPGEMICILCDKDKKACDNYSKVEEDDQKTTYDVSAEDNGHPCTTCPKGTDSPAGYTRELR